jgi:hypothetical protein
MQASGCSLYRKKSLSINDFRLTFIEKGDILKKGRLMLSMKFLIQKFTQRILFIIALVLSQLLTFCWHEKPKNYIDYKNLSDDQSIDYKEMMKDSITEEKKKLREEEKDKEKKFFRDFFAD